MASNGNGTMVWKVITVVFVPVLFFMGNNVIANDKDSRTRDEKLAEKQVYIEIKQANINSEILVALMEIQTDLKYIKRNVKEPTR